MILVKNPAGCTQALGYLSSIDKDYILVACLNDRAADGTDISWIWDADFELLNSMSSHIHQIYISGDRAQDLALRMKYAGLPEDRMVLLQEPEKLLDAFEKEALPLYIMPTYTAMLELRSAIVHRCGGAEFWE